MTPPPPALGKTQATGVYTPTSSYDEEKAAMRMALEWLLPSHAAATIFTDNQSLLKVIQSGSADTTDLRRMLNKRAGKTTLLWIPGHHMIAGNAEADACAKQAQQLPTVLPDQSPSPQPVHSSTELEMTHRLATAKQRRHTPKRFHGQPTVGLSPRGATLFSSPGYEPDKPPSLRLTPTGSTRQSTHNALVAGRSRKPLNIGCSAVQTL